MRIMKLLDMNPNTNIKTDNGSTALTFAIKNESGNATPEIVNRLINSQDSMN